MALSLKKLICYSPADTVTKVKLISRQRESDLKKKAFQKWLFYKYLCKQDREFTGEKP